MSDSGRPRDRRERWASDHERARQRAAERLSLPLPASENAWLDRHLRMCAVCATVAVDYEAQQASLRGLKEPLPPRDIWARTSAGLDRAERQDGRSIPNPSVFPGRGGPPGSRGARSIRGMRAEQRASAFRSGSRPVPPRLLGDRPNRAPRPPGLGWVAPFAALAALAIVIVVGGNAVLSGAASGIAPIRGSFATAASLTANVAGTPFATPIQVGAGEVAWLTPAQDGTYSLNLASVDQVCPTNAEPDCAPIAPASPRELPTVRTTLHTVLRSPSKKQLVVVTTGTKNRSGGSVIVVAVPTAVPPAGQSATAAPATASVPASPSATVAASASAPPAASAPSEVASGGTSNPSLVVAATATPSATAPAPPTPAVDSSVPASTAAAATPVASDAAPAPGRESAPPSASPTAPTTSDSASPALATDGSVPNLPQPTATALAIISNVVIVGETAAYSPDGTMLAFSARPADGSQGPDIYLWRPGDATAHALTKDHASVFSGWLNNQLLGSRAVGADGQPAASAGPGDSGSPASPADSAGATAPSATTGETAPTPSDSPNEATAAPSPSADPAATDNSAANGAGSASPTDPQNTEGSASVQFAATAASLTTARSFVLDPATGVEADLVASAWRPVVDPTGRFVAYWAGSLRYDAASLAWLPDRGAIVLASWPALRGVEPSATLAPVPLLDNSGGAVPPGEWDIRWDESGQHIAIWAADPGNPDLGRLTLLTIDATGRVDPAGVALHDAPALAGFSIGDGRLAWATPPGQDGEGSRVQVLAWSGENAGKIDSQPVSGGDAVVVVR